ncbi:MAG: hypothetical protein KBB83_07460 [Alphaproteobacteria bacterium]|nr:hypothetical protein [Alphaproteobacteria bacterium]
MLKLKNIFSISLFTILSITLLPGSVASQKSTQDIDFFPPTRLVSDAEHKAFLIATLDSCNNNDSMMISSYDITPKIFHNDNIAGRIISAAKRGAKIYIYYEHLGKFSYDDSQRLQVLQNCCARFEVNFNHSKCVVNKDVVAIGSYNWLSDFNDTSSNGTAVLKGSICLPLQKDIWAGMRFYQSLAHDNAKGVQKFVEDQSVFSPKLYNLGVSGQLTILRTPEAHCTFLNQTFEDASNDVHIFSPFVRFKRLAETFTDGVLRKLAAKHVRTVLVMLPEPCNRIPHEQTKIFDYLDKLQQTYPYFSYKTQKDFHAKTLVSDNMICEGSFNWFSAVDDIAHDANNYEVSVAIKGDGALNLLNSLRTSAIGQSVMQLNGAARNKQGLNSPAAAPMINTDNNKTPSIPRDFDKRIRIFSGAKYKREGFCVKLDNNYILDEHNKTLYCETEEQAKQVAYQVWLESQLVMTKETSGRDKKRGRGVANLDSPSPFKQTKPDVAKELSIPQSFDEHIKVYSGASFNKEGFCVKLDGKYIVDESNSIIYFPSQKLAKKSAYDVWVSSRKKRSYK